MSMKRVQVTIPNVVEIELEIRKKDNYSNENVQWKDGNGVVTIERDIFSCDVCGTEMPLKVVEPEHCCICGRDLVPNYGHWSKNCTGQQKYCYQSYGFDVAMNPNRIYVCRLCSTEDKGITPEIKQIIRTIEGLQKSAREYNLSIHHNIRRSWEKIVEMIDSKRR